MLREALPLLAEEDLWHRGPHGAPEKAGPTRGGPQGDAGAFGLDARARDGGGERRGGERRRFAVDSACDPRRRTVHRSIMNLDVGR